jgi:hypothetical protein
MPKFLSVFLIFLFLGNISVSAQVEVKTTKRIKLSDREKKTIEMAVSGGDTSFLFCFRDSRYSAIVRFECGSLSKADLKDLVDGMFALTEEKYNVDEASVDVGDFMLSKRSTMGMAYVEVRYKNQAWTSYRLGQCKKVKEEVYTALNW